MVLLVIAISAFIGYCLGAFAHRSIALQPYSNNLALPSSGYLMLFLMPDGQDKPIPLTTYRFDHYQN